jgi:type II secretory pathway component PulJ
VEAQVLLKVRLKHVRAILEKALDTIAEHPEILRILSRSLSRLVRESLGGAQATLAEALEGLEVGDTVDEVLRVGWRRFAPSLRRSWRIKKQVAVGKKARGLPVERWVGDPPPTRHHRLQKKSK